jgi:hypothetical protein
MGSARGWEPGRLDTGRGCLIRTVQAPRLLAGQDRGVRLRAT